MAGELPSAIIEAIDKDIMLKTDDTESSETVSSILDASLIEPADGVKQIKKVYGMDFAPTDRERDIKYQMLISATDSANKICQNIIDEEARKIQWRKFIIIFLSLILTISLGFIGYLIISKSIEVSDELIIALLIYVVANIFSLLYFMVKYITDNKYISMYKITYHKILDYLIQDKINASNS